MTRALAWLLLLAASVAGAQTHYSRGDLFKLRQYEATSAALTYYVDSTGNNANACTASGTDACLTIQGALGKLPKNLAQPVTISIGAGNFAAFQVSGFTIRYNGSLSIEGTLANVTPATGSATGTATSGTAGSSATPSNGTLTLTAAGWTVNDFAGKLVTITGGTGSGQRRIIVSNTADTLTIAGTWTAPGATSTFAIQDSSTIINTTSTIPNTLSGNGAFFPVSAVFMSNVADAPDFVGQVQVRWVRFTPGSNGVALSFGRGAKYWLRESFVVASGASGRVADLSSFSDIRISESYLQSAAGMFSMANGPFITLTRVYMYGGTTQVAVNTSAQLSDNNTTHAAFTVSAVATNGGNANVGLTGVIIDGAGGGSTVCLDNSIGSFAYPSTFGGTGVSISNCATALRVVGPGLAVLGAIWTGTTNTTAISLSEGGRARFTSSLTLAGTTEVSVDGTATTFAAIRALTPKRVTDPATLSSVWEQ